MAPLASALAKFTLGELLPGEHLRCLSGALQTSPFERQTSVVLSLTILNQPVPVYNIEVHGEHVYQVGEFGLLVHNNCTEVLAKFPYSKLVDIRKLVPPLGGREFADTGKLARLGKFDWSKYTPIEVSGNAIMNGMTRVEAALRAGITHLPAILR